MQRAGFGVQQLAVNELADWLEAIWQEGQDWVRVCVSFLSDPQERNFSPHHRVTFSFLQLRKLWPQG